MTIFWPVPARVPTFPGLYRPGLIEGRDGRNETPDAEVVSGALPPRPH